MSLLRVGNEHYVSLGEAASFYGLQYASEDGHDIRLTSPWSALSFAAGHRRARINETEVWLHEPPQRVNGQWALTQTDMRMFIDPVMRNYAHLAKQRHRVVVLDPGHGGTDPGAVSRRGLTEKALALAIAQRVKLRLANKGLPVFMTRETDSFVPLMERCAIAARQQADLFVSIHVNAAFNRQAHGLESYVLTAPGYASAQSAPEQKVQKVEYKGNGHDGANTCLAYSIQKSLVRQTGKRDRGLRHARFAVLKHAPCPAALVECGFLTNVRDESLLNSSSHLDNLAEGIASGILEYIDAVKRAKVVAQNGSSPFATRRTLDSWQR